MLSCALTILVALRQTVAPWCQSQGQADEGVATDSWDNDGTIIDLGCNLEAILVQRESDRWDGVPTTRAHQDDERAAIKRQFYCSDPRGEERRARLLASLGH